MSTATGIQNWMSRSTSPTQLRERGARGSLLMAGNTAHGRRRDAMTAEVVEDVEVVEVIQERHLDHLDDLDILDHLCGKKAAPLRRMT